MISLRSYADAYVRSLKNPAGAVEEFDACADVLDRIKTLRAFLPDASVALNAKRDAMNIAFPKASPPTRNFLLLLAQDGLLKELETLRAHVRAAAAEIQEKRHAMVSSAVPLQAKERSRVQKALAVLFHRDVVVEERLDPSLISGFAVQVDGWTYDASLKGRLERLQHTLNV